ncbi:MAG TPA: ATPase, T2SS/T4P/T4SS family [Phycisphaerales bacterium]|nr:ATPase, T2SS/T4P/T4SS family [Phycisphaerales bacterium]
MSAPTDYLAAFGAPDAPGTHALLLAQQAYLLVSPWKPVLLLLPFIGWAWLISSVYDKHAARFHLGREMWAAIHLCIGVLAIIVAIAIPMKSELSFWLGLFLETVVLGVSVAIFPLLTNKDERVPEQHRLRLDFSKMAEARRAKKETRQIGSSEIIVRLSDGKPIPVPVAESPEFEVRVAAEQIILRAREARAAEVDLAPGRDGAYVSVFLVDGVRTAGGTTPAADAVKVIDFWKSAAGLDVNDRRRKQTGHCSYDRDEEKHKLRVRTAGGQGGMTLNLLFDPEKAVRRKTDELGMLEQQAEELRTIVDDGKGVVLVAAMPDGGGTTLMYSLTRMHDAYTTNVQTLEFETQGVIEGVRQNVFDPTKEGQEFSTLVRSIMRRDPDVVSITDLPDALTAKEITRADQDRTRTYVLLRANGALPAVQLWMKAVGDPASASACLHGVVAVRLCRKLCINCRVAYQPSADMLKKLGLPADKVKQLFKKGGQVLIKNKPETCPVCQGVGYVGQEGLFEVYRLGDAERDLIKSNNLAGLRAELRKKQLPTIQQAALRKAIDGITSVEEVVRVTTEAKPQQENRPPADAAQPAGA